MPGDRQTASTAGLAGETARSLFSKFRTLLDANTAALGTMAAMERVLSGEYVFDRAFLEKSAREVVDLTHQAVYALNTMTGNSQVALYDRFMQVAGAVEDILAGRPGPDDARLTRPLRGLRLEERPKAGMAAALGELADRLGMALPAGFAVTQDAFAGGALTPAGRQAVTEALADPAIGEEAARVTVSLEPLSPDLPTVWQAHEVPARPKDVLTALDTLIRRAHGSGRGRRRGLHHRSGTPRGRTHANLLLPAPGKIASSIPSRRGVPGRQRPQTAQPAGGHLAVTSPWR